MSLFFKYFSFQGIILFFLLFSTITNAQNFESFSNFETIEMPQFSKDSADALEKYNENMFAYPYYVDLDVKNIAASVQKNDTIYYSLQIVSKYAYSLNLIFGTCIIPRGASLIITNPTKTSIAGPYSYSDIAKRNSLATPLIGGDTIQILYKEPIAVSDVSILKISKISHDYKGDLYTNSLLKAEPQACNVNINCSEGNFWQDEKRAVLRILVDGTSLCSATLINNTARNSIPYVITANHCLSEQSEAVNTVFYFNYEYPSCTNTTINSSQTMTGADLVATSVDAKLDFTLLQLDEIPPAHFNPYYAGWSIDNQAVSNVTCIHHPRGNAKKISISDKLLVSSTFLQYISNSHWKVPRWIVGTTESGSSGSALFNSNHQIVGVLSGGEADCTNSVNDYFAKISTAWDYYASPSNQLKQWLDPINSGNTYCTGFDPNSTLNYLESNITTMDSVSLYNFDTLVEGNWTGTNAIGWNTFADLIPFAEDKKIYALTYSGRIDDTQNLNDIVFYVWDGNEVPEQVLYSKSLAIDNIVDSITVTIIPDIPIVTNGKYWVGYKVLNNSTAFKGFMAKPRSSMNSMYINHPKEWISTDKIGCFTSLACITYNTNEIDTILYPVVVSSPFYLSKISHNEQSFTPKELFAIDSIRSIQDTTQLLEISSDKNVSNWSGPNELNSNCFANMYTIAEPIYIRSVKFGIQEIPEGSQNLHIMVWDSSFSNVLVNQIVETSELKEDYFNQVHLKNPLFVDTTFALGFCFSETTDYDSNISVYQFYNSNIDMTPYFKMNEEWWKYQDFNLQYNLAIQPIQCFSNYHYNPDSLEVLMYPIENFGFKELEVDNELIVYPNPTESIINIFFTKTRYKSVKITLYSSSGLQIKSQTATLVGNTIPISLEGFERGLYVIKIEFGNEQLFKKILKK